MAIFKSFSEFVKENQYSHRTGNVFVLTIPLADKFNREDKGELLDKAEDENFHNGDFFFFKTEFEKIAVYAPEYFTQWIDRYTQHSHQETIGMFLKDTVLDADRAWVDKHDNRLYVEVDGRTFNDEEILQMTVGNFVKQYESLGTQNSYWCKEDGSALDYNEWYKKYMEWFRQHTPESTAPSDHVLDTLYDEYLKAHQKGNLKMYKYSDYKGN